MIMHRSLWRLLRMLARAKWAWMFRGGRTPRTIIFLVIGLLVIALAMLGTAMRHFTMRHGRCRRRGCLLPVVLLTFCIANLIGTAGERAIAFTPRKPISSSRPFTRRELLIYKILKGIGGAAI